MGTKVTKGKIHRKLKYERKCISWSNIFAKNKKEMMNLKELLWLIQNERLQILLKKDPKNSLKL